MACRTPEKPNMTRQNVCPAPPPTESTATDNGIEGIPAAATSSSGASSRLTIIPPEILLNILELTDLVAPTGEVFWNPVDRYHLPLGATKGTAWKPPTALFLVSKALGAAASKVFLGRNRLAVRPTQSGFTEIRVEGRKANIPQLYGARELFTHGIDAGYLLSL